jgi:hypothetical protein
MEYRPLRRNSCHHLRGDDTRGYDTRTYGVDGYVVLQFENWSCATNEIYNCCFSTVVSVAKLVLDYNVD